MWRGGVESKPQRIGSITSISREALSLYDGLVKPCPDIEPMLRRQMTGVLRVSLLRESVEDAALPRDIVTEEVRRLIWANFESDKVVHGQVGRVSLTIAVPAGCGVTVISSSMSANVLVENLRSPLALIFPCQCTLRDVEGDVIVVDGLAKEVSGVSGRYIQTYYGIAGANSSNWQYIRSDMPEEAHHQSIRDVRGGTHIDGLRLKLECTDLRGQVNIRNCFGDTRFNKCSHQPGDKAKLLTDSGKIEIMLKEDLIGQVNITATSIAGPMRYPCLKPLGWVSTRNDTTLMAMSTIHKSGGGALPPWMMDADIVAHCREGEIRIDKMV